MKTLRWGVFGTAKINEKILPLLRSLPGHEVFAVASRDGVKAQAYAQQWGIARSHGSYETLCLDPDVDVIYNSLPNALHFEWTLRAIEAGKHVLCEKPLVLKADEAEKLQAAAQRRGVVVTEAYMYRYHPQTILVKSLLEQGVVGTPRFIQGSFHFTLSGSGNIRLDKAMGGGSLGDVGCYLTNYIRYLAGAAPVEVIAQQTLDSNGVDTAFVAQMRFASGLFAQFNCSFQALRLRRLSVLGSEACLEIPEPFKPGPEERLRIVRASGVEERVTRLEQDLYLPQLEHMREVIQGNSSPLVPLAESVDVARTLEALSVSAATSRPVHL